MHNSTWKKERDLLSEAYASVNETTHSPENSCKDDEYYCSKDKVCKKKVEEDAVPGAELPVDGAVEPEIDAQPVMSPTPQELDEDVKGLIKLIANPPPEDELIRLGYEGRLSEYVSMLQKKVDAAQAQLDLRKPAEESGA